MSEARKSIGVAQHLIDKVNDGGFIFGGSIEVGIVMLSSTT